MVAYSRIWVLIFTINSVLLFGQATYMQRNIQLHIRGATTKFQSNKFYQTGNESAVELMDNAEIYIYGDSTVALGKWKQQVATKVYFDSLKRNTAESVSVLTFQVSDGALYRNINFRNETSSPSKGILLRVVNNGRILRLGGSFTFPNKPVYLGSAERANVADYIKDTAKSITLRIEDSLKYINMSATNYFITSSRSKIEKRIKPGDTAKFPVGYNAFHFTPVEITNVSSDDYYSVTASPSLYDWDTTFVDKLDNNKKPLRPDATNIMWRIKATKSLSKADVTVQMIKSSTALFQQAFDVDSAILIRYVSAKDNNEGTAMSRTFWENMDDRSNVSYSIYPNISAAKNVLSLQRKQITKLDKFNIFTAALHIENDEYPLAKVQNIANWDTIKIVEDGVTKIKKLSWKVNVLSPRVASYNIYAAETNDFSSLSNSPVLLGKLEYNNTDTYTFDLSEKVLDTRPENVYFQITPIPSTDKATLLYNFNVGEKSPTKIVGTGQTELAVLGNPFSLERNDIVRFLITPKKNVDITRMTITLISPTAMESVIFRKTINSPEEDQLNIEIDPFAHGLYNGHYVVVAQLEYSDKTTEKVLNKFSIF